MNTCCNDLELTHEAARYGFRAGGDAASRTCAELAPRRPNGAEGPDTSEASEASEVSDTEAGEAGPSIALRPMATKSPGWAGLESQRLQSGSEASSGAVLPPACPTLTLRTFTLERWFARPPKDQLVCAVHLGRKVVHWSPPVAAGCAGATLTFDLGGKQVAGDVRVSVFALSELLEERRRQRAHGLPPRLTFDSAAEGPWGEGLEARRSGAATLAAVSDIVAGKETGCKFFLLFHTGFVAEDGALLVPLAMMDKAFKDKKHLYEPAGVGTLHFSPLVDQEAIAVDIPLDGSDGGVPTDNDLT